MTFEQAETERLIRERDEARVQLAAATVRETLLRRAVQVWSESALGPEANNTLLDVFLADPDPLAAAVARVVAATVRWQTWWNDSEQSGDPLGVTLVNDVERAVDALRALAPWWPS